MGLVYLNGELIAAAEARVSALDRGLLLGEGAFETLRSYDGRIFRLRAHLSRLMAALHWLKIEIPESGEELARQAESVLARSGLRDARLRITVTAGPLPEVAGDDRSTPTRLIEARPLDAPPAETYGTGVQVLSLVQEHGLGPLSGRKTTSYLAHLQARRAAQAQGAAEALLITTDGRVVEGAMSNVFMVTGETVTTPHLVDGALAGITRKVVLELLPDLGLEAREQTVLRSDLLQADEVFLTSSVAEVLPVARVDGTRIGAACPGATTRRILQAYQQLARSEGLRV